MLNRKGDSVGKWEELFAELELSAAEQEAAKAYLAGERGKDALGEISFRDLSAVQGEAVRKRFDNLIEKKERFGLQDVKADMGRLFQLLFARGKSTCCQMVPVNLYRILAPTEWADAPKMAAAHAAGSGMSTYPFSRNLLSVFEAAKSSPEILKQALSMEVSQSVNGKLILLALYFYGKYPKDARAAMTPEPEDMPLLSAYEGFAVMLFGNLYFRTVSQPLLEELTNALENGEIPECFLGLVGTEPKISSHLHKWVVGLSYLNYMYSPKLKNIVRLCLLANLQETLEALYTMSRGTKMDICTKGGAYDKVFGIDSEKYLTWAAKGERKNILRKQLAENTECYIQVMDSLPVEYANKLFLMMKEEKPELYRKLLEERQKDGNSAEREKLIDAVVQQDANLDAAKAWLCGESTLEEFDASFDKSIGGSLYVGVHEWELLANYYENYGDEEVYRRCEVYMLFNRARAFFNMAIRKQGKWSGNCIETERVKKVFADFETEGLGLAQQIPLISLLGDSMYSQFDMEKFLDCVKEYLSGHLEKRREDTLKVLAGADFFTRCIGLQVLAQDAGRNKAEILKYVNDSSKVVREELFGILCAHKEWEEDIKALLSSKKAAEREFFIRVLLHWQETGADYRECFTQAMENEKSAKVKELLENALGMKNDAASGAAQETSKAELVKNLHKGGKKRGLAWAYETPFSAVHMADNAVVQGETAAQQAEHAGSTSARGAGSVQDMGRIAADEEYLQAVLLCYASADGCGVSKNAAFLAKDLNAAEFAVYVNELFDKWVETGAEAKKRWVLYAAAIHGGSAIIEKLQRRIKEWPQQSRGAIACEAVKALSLSPLPQALLIVDGIARKFKYRQVQAAAGEALAFAAAQLGITQEELADRIVPDFGFDEKVERIFDYGERKFIVTLTAALEMEVFEADSMSIRGKKLKSLPAPGKKDDAAKAAAAYEEFKQLKKQLKTTVGSQKQRLEMALSTAREWDVDAWKRLFVKNPIMHQFAIGLIWGIYEGGRLIQSFRYMEDGSFNTEEEEEFVLPADKGMAAGNGLPADEKASVCRKIGLVHPIELTEESRAAWKEQLSDYEITQPFKQLDRTVYAMTEKEADTRELTRFRDKTVNDLSLGSRLSGLGWYRGSVQDAGCFDTYYREDKEIELGVELHFSGSYVGGENEEVTIYDARFYKAGTIAQGGYVYDEEDKEKAHFLKDVPARYFSEIVWQLTKAVFGAG